MQAGPLRQTIAVVGLLALTPTLVFTALGRLTAGEAAARAMITFGVVVLLGRALAVSLRFYVKMVERAGERRREQHEQRRVGDHAG